MSLRKGLARAGRTLDSPRKSLGSGVVHALTLDNPAGWLTGEESVGMSRDRAMKISTVNRCVEVLSNSMAVLPVYIMNERTKERLPDHRLGRVLSLITIALLLIDPLYLSALCGLFGGGDMNGIALLCPEWAVRCLSGALLIANALVFWRRILPVYRQSFSERRTA